MQDLLRMLLKKHYFLLLLTFYK